MAFILILMCGLVVMSLAERNNQNLQANHDPDISTMNLEIERLKEAMEESQSQMAEAKYAINTIKNLYQDLEDKYVNTKADLTRTKSELITTKSDLTRTKSDLTRTRQDVSSLKAAFPSSPVAFTVWGGQDALDDEDFTGTILFESVGLNLGNAYSGPTAQFTCPITGLYLFSYNALTVDIRQRKFLEVCLTVNSALQHCAFCSHNDSDGHWMNCVGIEIMRCESGQRVRVEKTRGKGRISISDKTWFNGFLIRSL